MQGVPCCECGATFLCFLGKCHIWFKTAGLKPDGDEINNNNNKINWVYWIRYTPYVASLHKLSSTISQFCSGKQFFAVKNNQPSSHISHGSGIFNSHMMLWRHFWFFWMHIVSEGIFFPLLEAYVWIWGLFEGRCSSWLHLHKLPLYNWPLF